MSLLAARNWRILGSYFVLQGRIGCSIAVEVIGIGVCGLRSRPRLSRHQGNNLAVMTWKLFFRSQLGYNPREIRKFDQNNAHVF